MKSKITITGKEKVKFNNNVDYCVGTGRMGLALTKEYLDQLSVVQKDIGFKFIRGHGLFSDDMAIYQEFKDRSALKKTPADFKDFREYFAYVDQNAPRKIEYNFTYLDRVMDEYLKRNICAGTSARSWSLALCPASLQAASRQFFTGRAIQLRQRIIKNGQTLLRQLCVILWTAMAKKKFLPGR